MKKVQVIWSDEALNDLETIYDFLAENSQPAAQHSQKHIEQVRATGILPGVRGKASNKVKRKSVPLSC